MTKHPKPETNTAIALPGLKDHEEGAENQPMEVGLRVPNAVWKDNASASNATPSRELVGSKNPIPFPFLPPAGKGHQWAKDTIGKGHQLMQSIDSAPLAFGAGHREQTMNFQKQEETPSSRQEDELMELSDLENQNGILVKVVLMPGQSVALNSI